MREAWPSYGFEGAAHAYLGEQALVGRGLGDFHEPVDLVTELRSNANEFGFLCRRQNDPVGVDASAQDRDLGLQQSQLRIVPRHEELAQEDQKQRESRIHLAGLHYGV